MAFLGLDVGTSTVTAVVMDAGAQVLARESAALRSSFPGPDRVEQDPEDILLAVSRACAPLLSRFRVEAMGLDHQGESFVLWERSTGAALTPNIVWQDRRGQARCAVMARSQDAADLTLRTGLRLSSYFSAPKLAELFHDHPALRTRAEHGEVCFGTLDSFLVRRLGVRGLHVTEPSSAARTLLYNLQRRDWDDVALCLFGVPAVMMPALVPSAGLVDHLVLSPGTAPVPLWGVLTDQQAALWGLGGQQAGSAKCTLGTGSFVLLNTGSRTVAAAPELLSTVAWQLGDDVTYALEGGTFAAGAAAAWLSEGLHATQDAADSQRVALESRDEDVVVVPSLCGLGAPHWVEDAGAAVLGLKRFSTHADVVAATLRGVAWEVADVVASMEKHQGMPLTRLTVDGGASRNAYLTQALADALGRTIHVSMEAEGTARGSAMLAASACGAVPAETWAALLPAAREVAPVMTPSRRHVLQERWRRAISAVRTFHGV